MEPFSLGTNASGDLIGLPAFGSMSRTRRPYPQLSLPSAAAVPIRVPQRVEV